MWSQTVSLAFSNEIKSSLAHNPQKQHLKKNNFNYHVK